MDRIELNLFGDNSHDVFCVIGFLRARLIIYFVFGKARFAIEKALSIPKLELQAALLATWLKVKIVQALSVKVNIFVDK